MSMRHQSLESRVPGVWPRVIAWTASRLLVIALAVSNSSQALAQSESTQSKNPPVITKREPVGSAQPTISTADAAGLTPDAAKLVDAMADSATSSRSGVTLRTAIFVMEGSDSAKTFVELLESNNSCKCTLVTSDKIRSKALASFEVVLIPGGSASKQFADLGEEGRKALRQFVENGGGYVGICAGGFLASYLNIVNAKTLGKNAIPGPDTATSADVRPSGAGVVKMELTDAGRKVFGDQTDPVQTLFSGGPIFYMAGQSNLSECICLARYRSEILFDNFLPGTMKDTPAILAAQFGKGRVIIFSPHPESSRQGTTPGIESIVVRAVRATARKPVENESDRDGAERTSK